MDFLQLRNAESRARWLLGILTNAQCADPWTPDVRLAFEFHRAKKLKAARNWIANRHVRRMPINVIPLRRVTP